MDSGSVRYERRDDVAIMTLARPAARNAIDESMRARVHRISDQLSSDHSIRCLVVAGDGPTFCAGVDLSEFTTGAIADFAQRSTPNAMLDDGWQLASMFEWIPRLPFPSIAAVRGHAFGAGMQLALACDFRILADDAVFGLPEMEYGLVPDMGATYRLPRLIGEARARQLILLSTVVGAWSAEQVGLATRVVPAAELMDSALDLAIQIAGKSATAITAARSCLNNSSTDDDHLRLAVRAQADCLLSPEFRDTQTRLRHRTTTDRAART
ncbi:enoyl-CoA hydratase/isomerase family protein [Jongsikchunia kroppenstedtii]|uniref:enoyl-CoA hydratase/isomerase family protein n=1 Tax=Jongsikchunia kroppenstedtii TaxID=1121721 RepID=UPI00035E7CD6|nr:enoyl-CoA hydratase/isomerase family protein [Jongsikchunia kroppenstedtii]